MLDDTKNTIQHAGLNNIQRQQIAERQSTRVIAQKIRNLNK